MLVPDIFIMLLKLFAGFVLCPLPGNGCGAITSLVGPGTFLRKVPVLALLHKEQHRLVTAIRK